MISVRGIQDGAELGFIRYGKTPSGCGTIFAYAVCFLAVAGCTSRRYPKVRNGIDVDPGGEYGSKSMTDCYTLYIGAVFRFIPILLP